MTTPVPPMTDIPPFPALADRAAGTYNSKAYDFGSHMADTFNDELAAVAANVLDNATDAEEAATIASTAASTATTKAGEATTAAASAAQDADDADAARIAAQAAAATAGAAAAFTDTNPVVKGSADATKQIRFEVDGLTPGTTRTLTPPDASITLAGTNLQQAFTKPQRPSLSSETTPVANAITWDLTTDSVLRINLNAAITTFNLTGTLASLAGYQYRATVRYNGASAITWPATVKWAASAPTLTGTSGKLDMFTFEVATTDGTNYYLCEIGRSQNVG